MEDELISFNTAKLAKEKGFDEWCETVHIEYIEDIELFDFRANENYIYRKKGDIKLGCDKSYLQKENKTNCIIYKAPTQSLLQRWLREKHNIDVVLSPERYSDGVNYLVQAQKWDLNADPETTYNFIIKGSYWYNDNHEYPTYEEALEKGLQEALKLI